MNAPQFSLDTLIVRSPCDRSWSGMTGTEQVRFCTECEKNVYDLSGMTRQEGEDLIETHEGKLCVRFLRRPDGTIITSECTRGLPLLRKKAVRTRLRMASSFAALLAMLGLSSCSKQQEQPQQESQVYATMGATVTPPDSMIAHHDSTHATQIMGGLAVPVTSVRAGKHNKR